MTFTGFVPWFITSFSAFTAHVHYLPSWSRIFCGPLMGQTKVGHERLFLGVWTELDPSCIGGPVGFLVMRPIFWSETLKFMLSCNLKRTISSLLRLARPSVVQCVRAQVFHAAFALLVFMCWF
jgi:hypothetical protein